MWGHRASKDLAHFMKSMARIAAVSPKSLWFMYPPNCNPRVKKRLQGYLITFELSNFLRLVAISANNSPQGNRYMLTWCSQFIQTWLVKSTTFCITLNCSSDRRGPTSLTGIILAQNHHATSENPDLAEHLLYIWGSQWLFNQKSTVSTAVCVCVTFNIELHI